MLQAVGSGARGGVTVALVSRQPLSSHQPNPTESNQYLTDQGLPARGLHPWCRRRLHGNRPGLHFGRQPRRRRRQRRRRPSGRVPAARCSRPAAARGGAAVGLCVDTGSHQLAC
jgi:hypothetical protein